MYDSTILLYTNNSPDTVTFIWIQTERNAFKSQKRASFIYAQGSRFGARGFRVGTSSITSTRSFLATPAEWPTVWR